MQIFNHVRSVKGGSSAQCVMELVLTRNNVGVFSAFLANNVSTFLANTAKISLGRPQQ